MKQCFKYILSLLLVLTFFYGFSQQENLFPIEGQDIPFMVYKTADESINISNILKGSYEFKKTTGYVKNTCPDDIYWIRLNLKDETHPLNTNEIWHLKFNAFDYGEMYYICNDTLTIKPIGLFDKNTESERIKSQKYFSQVTFYPDTYLNSHYLYLKVKRVLFTENISSWKFTYHPISLNNIYKTDDLKTTLPIYFFIGISSIMSLLMFLFYIYLKRVEFFYNSFYVFWLLVLIAKDELLVFFGTTFSNTLMISWMLENSVIMVALGYMMFMIHYLNLKKDYAFAYKVLKISIALHILILIVDFFFYYFGYFHGRIFILEILPILDSVSAFLSVGYILLFHKNLISIIFVAGSIIFMVGVGCYYYLDNAIDPLNYNKIYIIIGSAIEIMIFAFGLSYKVQSEQLERLRFQEEAFLNKTKALRAQINPHFIFNSLSSIQHLVTKNDRVSALKYLSKFSRLTRNVLESSFETNMLLSDEIKMLNDYLELESLRFDNAFEYAINIDDDLDSYAVEIPSMLLQPFVENAIIHGLLPKLNGDKRLVINFKKLGHLLISEVEDNGVGRETSSKKEHIHKRDKKSRGLEVTKQRLENMGLTNDHIEIIDKVDENRNPIGTKVVIRIPLK